MAIEQEALHAAQASRRKELARRSWDAVVVGAGHNGLTAAAYLARAGRSVLVLERRDRVGGACTLERPFSDPRYLMSPCAYLVGLLHPLVVGELDLGRHGYRAHLADPQLWCPFEDGSALALWADPERSAVELAGLAPRDVAGYLAFEGKVTRIRAALRDPARDTWLGDPPGRGELEELLGHDQELIDMLFGASIAEVVEAHVADERLRAVLCGQGVIGTFAGPRDPGTAAVYAFHGMGALGGVGSAWGYVEGGMGRISLALAAAAREAGAVIVTGVPVGAILPGEGVQLEGGELVRARAVVSCADPKRTLALCQGPVDPAWAERVRAWRTESAVIKVNCTLSRLPRFLAARPGEQPHRAAAVSLAAGGTDTIQAGCEAARRGEPDPAWCELYFHAVHDPSVAPPGGQVMSAFAQYAPYQLARGGWDSRREEIGDFVLSLIARFAPDIVEVVEEREVLGPPDVEARIGLTGGHIFQGEILPDQMWDRRFHPRTPLPGLYLCGAATHPGGSVIAANGRNAAMAVLADLPPAG